MGHRERVSQAMARLALPEAVASLEQARREGAGLVRANELFNSLHVEARHEHDTKNGPMPADPFDPGEAEEWEAGLEKIHGLQAQAMAWRLSEFLEKTPAWGGFEFEQSFDRQARNRHATRTLRVLKGSQWVQASDLGVADQGRARKLESFLDSLPDLLVFSARNLPWIRPSGGQRLIEGLMEQAKGAMGPASFAAWERLALKRASPPASSDPAPKILRV